MKKFLLLICTLLGTVGAWATTYTVTLGNQVTDISTLSAEKFYVLKNCGSSFYNYYDGTQMNAKSDYDYSSVVVLDRNGTDVTIKQVSTGTYYQGLVNNERLALGTDAVTYTFNTEGVSAGQFRFANNNLYLNRYGGDTQYPIGAATSFAGDYSRWTIYEVTVTKGFPISVGTSTGTFYSGGTTAITPSSSNQFAKKWESTSSDPAKFTITCGSNNMIINSNDATATHFRLHSDTYTMSVDGGYIITGYTIKAWAENGNSKIGDTAVGTSKENATTITKKDLTASTATFTVSGTANPWMYIEEFTVTVDIPNASVTYVIKDNEDNEVYTSEALPTTPGTVITTLPAEYQRPYCTYSAINQTMEAGENTVNVIVTYNLPFTVSTSFADATWYYATLRGTKYVRADESQKDGSRRYLTNNTNERTDAYKWAFFGNPYTYFYIANKAHGDSKYLYADNQPIMETVATPTSDIKALWDVVVNECTTLTGGSSLRSITGPNKYINDNAGNGNLGFWDNASSKNNIGSVWKVEEVTASDKAALGDAITAAQALVNGADVPGYINSTAAATLNSAISTAQGVYDDPSGDYVSAYNTLTAAITAASVPANINYTPRTDVYYTIVNARGAMVYDPSHSSSVDTQNDNAEYIWYGSTTPDATNPNNLWGFIERDGNYYMYNVGKRQFASVGHGTYGNTWIFSNTPAYITLDDGIADEIVPPGVRVRATIATTGSSYTMSVSTNYTGPVITYDYNGDGGVPMVFAESSYSVSSEVTSAIEALIEDVTPYRNALKAVIDGCASIIGDGVNKYASNGTYSDALAAANTAYNNASATKSELQTAKSNLENAIAGLSINLPGTGFYRIKGATSNKYLAAGVASNSKFAMTNAEDATTIFYFADSKLLNYSTGFYSGLVSGNGAGGWTWAIGAENASTTTFKDGHTQGGYGIQSADVYLYDNGDGTNSADRGGASGINLATSNVRYRSWKLTEVTTLPVTISSALYATLYAPVALTIPSGVQAYYISELTTTEATLTEIKTTIPANTPVILKAGQADTYNFAITTADAFSGTNKLAGQIAAFAVSADDVTNKVYYTLQQNRAGTAVGLFPKTAAGSIAGFKAYLPAANFPSEGSVKGFTFIFDNGDETGINDIQNGQVIMNGDAIFNLAGQRLNKLQRGVNIVNGKKVLVK